MRECARRIKTALWRHGERFTLAGEEYYGVFSLLSPEEASRYGVSLVEGAGINRIWAVFVPFDAMVPNSGTLVRGSMSLNVLTVVDRFWRGDTLFRVLVASE